MPAMQTVLGTLNANMSHSTIRAFARENADDFAPGKPLAPALAAAGAGGANGPLYPEFLRYLEEMPGGMAEALRATIHYALTTHTMITFAWAPAYDFGLDLWQAPDTATTRGGITVLVRSRYPNDPHPIKQAR